jgi:hypothetical protein
MILETLQSNMILRNLTMTSKSRYELEKVLSSSQDLRSLTLYNVSSCCDEDDRCNYDLADDQRGNEPDSSSPVSKQCLNVDFLCGGTSLQELTIERCRMDVNGSGVFAQALRSCSATLKSLKIIDLTLNNDCDDLWKAIANVDKTLEAIEFRQVHMEASIQIHLLQALRYCPNIRTLHLEECGIQTEQVPHLAQLLQSLPNLISLNVCRNNIDGTGLGILVRQGLHYHPSLRKLTLSHNPLGDDGACHLSDLLSSPDSTSKIEWLSLIDCDIWGPGCETLAQGLAGFGTLKELIVDGEWEEHFDTTIKSLKRNMILTRLWVPGAPVLQHNNDPKWKQVDYYLHLNRCKRRLLLERNLPLAQWPDVLVEGKADADLFFYLLRQRPELVNCGQSRQSET